MTFGDEDYDPAGYLLGVDHGTPVAYGGTTLNPKRRESGFDDAYVSMFVVPEIRGRGIEDHLMEFTFDFIRSKGIGAVRMLAHERSDWRGGLAEKAGMKAVRHGYRMRYCREKRPEPTPLPARHILRVKMIGEMSDGDIAEFVAAFNESFTDHWNFSPVPVERFIKLRDEGAALRESDMRLASAVTDGQISGVCFCEISQKYNRQHGEKASWINILGVKKPFRRAGLGRALLSEAIAWMWDSGMNMLYLGVDAENTKALGLYESVGFKIEEESTTYELKL